MKLYDFALSGHCHRVRLFLSLIGIQAETVAVDLKGGAHKAPDFIAMNRFGQVPVLEDDGLVVQDSNAILVYLATKYSRHDWLPQGAAETARVQRWLSVAAGQIASGPAAARMITVFGAAFDPETTISRAHAILTIIDNELNGHDWIAATTPTIADVALYSYIAAAPEGNVDLAPYGHIRAWLKRVEALPGFLAFPKTAAGLVAA
ncbi:MULTISPECIES: glutathione S-transferase family protein [Asticcacaulis]|uniref:glutathione S-transferase family protein n=1 Tax=Asticcacaulis TaxID=76890 RepID=UPI001AE8ED83|nr:MULTISPECIES: glutathione S-transferase [Asticcacaulis]MBP2158767.1 glutathione S-transferase [Asticcacaulis solisilvae]MDR6799813.1 glutathione S-transferase [Asticcacaulis sp. BE141]